MDQKNNELGATLSNNMLGRIDELGPKKALWPVKKDGIPPKVNPVYLQPCDVSHHRDWLW